MKKITINQMLHMSKYMYSHLNVPKEHSEITAETLAIIFDVSLKVDELPVN